MIEAVNLTIVDGYKTTGLQKGRRQIYPVALHFAEYARRGVRSVQIDVAAKQSVTDFLPTKRRAARLSSPQSHAVDFASVDKAPRVWDSFVKNCRNAAISHETPKLIRDIVCFCDLREENACCKHGPCARPQFKLLELNLLDDPSIGNGDHIGDAGDMISWLAAHSQGRYGVQDNKLMRESMLLCAVRGLS